MTRPTLTRTPTWALASAAALVLLALSGCTAGSDGPTDALDGAGREGGPTLYLNVTANGETHRFSTGDLPGGGHNDEGDGEGDDADDGSDVDANATSSSGTMTAQGNATAGNGTAQGNATASNGTANGSASGGPAGGSGMPGVPSGAAPLNVTVEIGASGLPESEAVNWTVRWDDAASATAGNGSASASANGTAAKQNPQESGSSFPARLRHTYDTGGRYDLTFVAQVAGQALDTLRTAVVVGEGTPSMPAGTPLGNLTDRFEGSIGLSDPFCASGGSEEFDWILDSTFNGTPSTVQRIVVVAEVDGLSDLTLTLVDANGTEIASGPEIDETGPFPVGAYQLVAEACGSAGTDFVITATQEHVSL